MEKIPGTVTRGAAAKLLGCSRTWIQKLERRGRLKAVIDRDGVHHFAKSEVMTLANQRGRPGSPEGKLVAEVFSLFEQGMELPSVCIRTQQTTATIRMLWDEYKKPLAPRDDGIAAAIAAADARGVELEAELGRLTGTGGAGDRSGVRLTPTARTNGHANGHANGKANAR